MQVNWFKKMEDKNKFVLLIVDTRQLHSLQIGSAHLSLRLISRLQDSHASVTCAPPLPRRLPRASPSRYTQTGAAEEI